MSIRWLRKETPLPADREQMIPALLTERATYVRYGKTDRVEQVDEQLQVYGYDPAVGFEPAKQPAPPTADEQTRDERRRQMIPALLAEREDYVRRDQLERVHLVDEQLAFYGHRPGAKATQTEAGA